MRPLEPDSGDAQADNIDHTFRRLAQAEHAPADFHAQVMARAAQLPLPRQKGRVRPAVQWFSFLRLPRAATVALASVLLVCMAGLGYVYLHVTQWQAVAEQEQVRQQQRRLEVAHLRQAYTEQQRRAGKAVEPLTEGERGALTEVTLEMPGVTAEGDASRSAKKVSVFTRMIETVQDAFRTVWSKVQRIINPEAPATAPEPAR